MRIKAMREIFKISQAALGNVVGVERSTICQYESGKRRPDVSILEAMANYFNVSIDFLMGRDFEITIPVSTWHQSLQDDYARANSNLKEYMLYKYGGIKFSTDQELPATTELTDEQKQLYDFIAGLSHDEIKELSGFVDYIISKRK
jgi:transcriptional regulator with XRE-family HTH domain